MLVILHKISMKHTQNKLKISSINLSSEFLKMTNFIH